jgi:hypothetical protein
MTTGGRRAASLLRLTWPAFGSAVCLIPFLLVALDSWPETRLGGAVALAALCGFLFFVAVSLVYVVRSLRAPLPIPQRLLCAALNLMYPAVLAAFLLMIWHVRGHL